MKITNIKHVEDFLTAVNKCKGGVKLTSKYGDVYNLKSKLSQFLAIAALLDKHGDELELWCDEEADEFNFHDFFINNPEVL